MGLALDLSGGLDHFCDWEDSLEDINDSDSNLLFAVVLSHNRHPKKWSP